MKWLTLLLAVLALLLACVAVYRTEQLERAAKPQVRTTASNRI